MTTISREILIDEHVNQGKTRAQIAEKFGCSSRTISRLLNKYAIKGCRYRGIYTKNDIFFNAPNNNNCYWAGFIAADGCISIRKGSNPTLIINLAEKDRDLLVKFSQVTEYTGEISETRHVDGMKTHIGARLSIYNARFWFADLTKHWNITTNKSLTLKPPNITDKYLKLQYIIGLIDGDGYIGISKNKLYFSLLGTAELLEWVSETFNEFESYPKMNVFRKDKKSNCFTIQCNHLRAYKLLKSLQQIQTPYRLARKWDKIAEYENAKQLFPLLS